MQLLQLINLTKSSDESELLSCESWDQTLINLHPQTYELIQFLFDIRNSQFFKF